MRAFLFIKEEIGPKLFAVPFWLTFAVQKNYNQRFNNPL
jgi:hypothetical protein